MNNISEVIELLSKEKVENINIINFLSNYHVDVIEKAGQSIMVKGTSDKKWVYISCKLEEELRRLKEKLTKDHGAIGFLHVLPKYRRKGYAKSITIDLSKKVQKENKIPFVHIEESNENSMMLALDLGFEKYKRVSWFEVE